MKQANRLKDIYLIQVESQSLMIINMRVTKKQFDEQLKKAIKEFNFQYDDENYRDEMGAKIETVKRDMRETHHYMEHQTMIEDGITRTWFISRKCIKGYAFNV